MRRYPRMSKFKTVDAVREYLNFASVNFKRHTDRKAEPYVAFYDASGEESERTVVSKMSPEEIVSLIEAREFQRC